LKISQNESTFLPEKALVLLHILRAQIGVVVRGAAWKVRALKVIRAALLAVGSLLVAHCENKKRKEVRKGENNSSQLFIC
jgi:hypothetical protein